MTAVAVVGAINIDLIVAAGRLPGPGETVLGARLLRSGGGKGANAAVAAARAGAEVRLIGAVGADPDGTAQRAELAAAGVDVEDVAVLPATGTGAALIVTDPAGENQIAVAAGANAELSADHVRAALDRRPPGLVLVSSEVSPSAIAAAVRWAAAAGAGCVLNPAPVRPELAGLVGRSGVLTPNERELAELAGLVTGHPEPDAAVRSTEVEDVRGRAALLAARSDAAVVATLGAAGALIARPDGTSLLIAAPEVT
ncbi:MAG TPA: PfkB family carbohydrate kinase, partial [Jatrophihabitans sp.]|nr:PfkB family carbohydrate kinase [Jatrophihabitans sp.]